MLTNIPGWGKLREQISTGPKMCWDHKGDECGHGERSPTWPSLTQERMGDAVSLTAGSGWIRGASGRGRSRRQESEMGREGSCISRTTPSLHSLSTLPFDEQQICTKIPNDHIRTNPGTDWSWQQSISQLCRIYSGEEPSVPIIFTNADTFQNIRMLRTGTPRSTSATAHPGYKRQWGRTS